MMATQTFKYIPWLSPYEAAQLFGFYQVHFPTGRNEPLYVGPTTWMWASEVNRWVMTLAS